MGWLRALLVRWGWRGGMERIEREIDQELRFHIDERTAANLALGMSEEEARADAVRRFGDLDTVRAQARSILAATPTPAHERHLLETVRYEVWHALRTLWRNPSVTGPAVLSLGLGIAVVTTVFSVADLILFRGLAFPEADRLVAVWGTDAARGVAEAQLSIPDLVDLRARSQTLDLAGYWIRSANLAGGGEPERVRIVTATSDIFDVLGIAPAVGRGFRPEEERPGRDLVVVLRHEFWIRRLGAAPDVLGQTMELDGESREIIGIMPPEVPPPFQGSDLWLPQAVRIDAARSARAHSAVGRLRDGVSPSEAHAEIAALADRLADAFPGSNAGLGARVIPFRTVVFDGDARVAGIMLLTAALLALVVACANVANLLLARALHRARELAARAALGASRLQIVRQLLVESTLLGLAGGVLGVILSGWGIQWLRFELMGSYLGDTVAPDLRVLSAAALVAAATGLLVGTAPALRCARSDQGEALRHMSRGLTPGRGEGRVQRALVVVQGALTVVLLSTTLLLVGRVRDVSAVDLGFGREGVLVARTSLDAASYPDEAAVRGFYADLLAQIGALPGVSATAGVSIAPLTGLNTGVHYLPEGEEYPEGRLPLSPYRAVTPRYFDVLRIPTLEGRGFGPGDGPDAPPAVILSERLARRHWPDESPLGKRLRVWDADRTVVGIVGDIRHFSPEGPPTDIIYLPTSQLSARTMDVVIGTGGDPAALVPGIRAALARLDPSQPLFSVLSMEGRYWEQMRSGGVLIRLSGVVAVLSLLLSLVGIYGVSAHWASRGQRETGIRIALGARRERVLVSNVGKAFRISATGAALGMGLAFALQQLFASSAVFVAGDLDVTALVGPVLLILVGGPVAAYQPARQASHSDPLEVLSVQ